MGSKWHVARALSCKHTRVFSYAHTNALHNCRGITPPVCGPTHFLSLAVGGPTVWACDELLMAATWHCRVAFSMTVASVPIFLHLLYTPGVSAVNKAKDWHLS